MKINIGLVIQRLRKIKGLTQEQVANEIGVSKAAVSKWESGNTYPDITLLAPLARLLDTNINELLEFNLTITEKEIEKITSTCEQEFSKGDYFLAYDYCEKVLKKYPNVLGLKLTIASLYFRYTVLLKDDEDSIKNMIKRACELAQQASESLDNEVKESSLQFLTSLYMMQEDYESALENAKKLNPKANDTMILLATIYQSKGEIDTAKKLYQELLLSNISTSVLVLRSLSKILENESNVNEAEFFLETIIKLDTLFEIQNDGEACALQLSELYARNNKKDESIIMLKRYINYIKSIIYDGYESISSSRFFTEIPSKPNSEETSKFLKQHIAHAIINTPSFDKIKDNEEFKNIIEELKDL